MPNGLIDRVSHGQCLNGRLLLLLVWCLQLLSAPCVRLVAQVVPSATSNGPVIWVGAQYSDFQTDFENNRIGGLGVYADFDRAAHWGVEADARWFRLGETGGQSVSNYLVGDRYRHSLKHETIVPYAKVLVGAGLMNYPSNIGHGSYFAFAPGGGVDFRISPRFAVRTEYEYQGWPAAPGFPGIPSHGLSPNGISIGFAWRVP